MVRLKSNHLSAIQEIEYLDNTGKLIRRLTHKGDFNPDLNALTPGTYLIRATYEDGEVSTACLLYTSPSPRDKRQSRMPSSA